MTAKYPNVDVLVDSNRLTIFTNLPNNSLKSTKQATYTFLVPFIESSAMLYILPSFLFEI